jgi:hypothetical protein
MAKDFVFRIKPGDPLPPIAPSGYRFMLDESTGTIKLLSSDGTVVNPTSDAFAPTIDNLQGGDFLYSNDGIGFQNIAFDQATLSIITNNYGYQEYTYVEQTLLTEVEIYDLSGGTITLISQIDEGFYAEVEKIICEIKVKNPFVLENGSPKGLVFEGRATGAIENIDISFLTSTTNSFIVQHSNTKGNGWSLPIPLDSEGTLSMGLNSPADIVSGEGEVKITVVYKLREFGAEYKMP